MRLMLELHSWYPSYCFLCTLHAGNSLTIDDLRTVNNAVFEMRAKWLQLGIELGVKPGTLESIKQKNMQDPNSCLPDLLTEWLKAEEPTWEKLVEALKSDTVSERNLARRIERDHCTKPGSVLYK